MENIAITGNGIVEGMGLARKVSGNGGHSRKMIRTSFVKWAAMEFR
jgi:hypothetical protein